MFTRSVSISTSRSLSRVSEAVKNVAKKKRVVSGGRSALLLLTSVMQEVIKRRGEFLYGVAPCTAALQVCRRKIHAVYQKVGYLEKKPALKRYRCSFLCHAHLPLSPPTPSLIPPGML